MKYFTLRELTRSATADKYNIDNTPNATQQANLEALVAKVLDPLRQSWGKAIIVTSGFRCVKLNSLVGGASASQHTQGMAADIKTTDGRAGNLKLFKLIQTLKLPFDQLIYEYGDDSGPDWIHVSYSKTQRRGQKLRKYANSSKYIAI
jgi:hypothetical protein